MTPARRRTWTLLWLIASAAIWLTAAAVHFGWLTNSLPAPDGPPAHPQCGGPVLALGATQLQQAYGVPAMLAAGINGTGTTIADIVPYANPDVAHDLDVYSRRYGLPPAHLDLVSYGQLPAAGANGAAPWQREGTEDVEMMHALAPDATLIYVQIPGTADNQIMYDQTLSWVVARFRPDVVSYSSGTPEWAAAAQDQAGLLAAEHAGVTVVAGSGDTGATEPEPDGTSLYPSHVALWPASDPLVTAVGGTWLHVNQAGRRIRPDTVFSDVPGGDNTAGGAGLSAVFARPSWQDGVRAIVGDHRGIADVSMDGSECSPGAAYRLRVWGTTQGTSMGTALFAALVADAAQVVGRPLGLLGQALYSLHGTADGLLDVTQGNDSIPGMPGWPARPGYDLPTGIGTVAAARPFVTALARAASRYPPEH